MMNNTKNTNNGIVTLLAGIGLVAVASTALATDKANSAGVEERAKAQFVDDMTAKLPEGYRGWVHVGTFFKEPGSKSILDGSTIEGASFAHTYVEPSALAAYKESGKWPDGTQFVKEFAVSSLDDGSCDKKTGLCSTEHGVGIFENYYLGLAYMVKDAERFPDAAGNWGYFGFGPAEEKGGAYPETAELRSVENCAGCHIAHVADKDYVFSDLHIGLQ
ncbi:cytochrome P460 family protein [Halomonas binhaiensis]|uniref:Cytochrome P460 family protein n=1 Tax=Halomonas binhaiensis TaxID=2562282 RepID=A0A5C1NFZ4_9GAMM|nr:cytochrome P460 family protein [Halomonas binhaiensis]QEM82156.1 cytochrome P460 family protein [Halomonas binhaiensis]